MNLAEIEVGGVYETVIWKRAVPVRVEAVDTLTRRITLVSLFTNARCVFVGADRLRRKMTDEAEIRQYIIRAHVAGRYDKLHDKNKHYRRE